MNERFRSGFSPLTPEPCSLGWKDRHCCPLIGFPPLEERNALEPHAGPRDRAWSEFEIIFAAFRGSEEPNQRRHIRTVSLQTGYACVRHAPTELLAVQCVSALVWTTGSTPTGKTDISITLPLEERGRLARSTRCPAPSRQGEPFNFSRQVITHTRRSSRFGRPQSVSGLRERKRWSIGSDRRVCGCLDSLVDCFDRRDCECPDSLR